MSETKSPATKATTTKVPAKATNGEAAKKPALNGTEIKLLAAMSKSKTHLDRPALTLKTGIKKGFSAILGAATSDGVRPETLIGRGLVKPVRYEGERVAYLITAAGRKALEKTSK